MATKGTLTPKQLAFCREYIANGGNATKAYIHAGYSPNGADSAACRLLSDVRISQEIESRQIRIEMVGDVTQGEVIRDLRRQSRKGKTAATIALGKLIGMWRDGAGIEDSWDEILRRADERARRQG